MLTSLPTEAGPGSEKRGKSHFNKQRLAFRFSVRFLTDHLLRWMQEFWIERLQSFWLNVFFYPYFEMIKLKDLTWLARLHVSDMERKTSKLGMYVVTYLAIISMADALSPRKSEGGDLPSLSYKLITVPISRYERWGIWNPKSLIKHPLPLSVVRCRLGVLHRRSADLWGAVVPTLWRADNWGWPRPTLARENELPSPRWVPCHLFGVLPDHLEAEVPPLI